MSFISSLNAALSGRGIQTSSFCNTSDATEKRILTEYGAVFLADKKVSIPSRFMFDSESEVTKFQSSVKSLKKNVGGVVIELQEAAMNALLKAADEVKKKNLTLKPRGGTTAARRVFADTVTFWNDRIKSGISHWKANTNSKGKKLTEAEGKTLASLSGLAQVKEVLKLETEGFFFSKDKTKTILASVAAPGTSQHLFMLAVDIEEFGNPTVRKIMAEHGWFQTAFSDQPHFTFFRFERKRSAVFGTRIENFRRASFLDTETVAGSRIQGSGDRNQNSDLCSLNPESCHLIIYELFRKQRNPWRHRRISARRHRAR